MANPGNHSAADGHQQSISGEDGQPVDGIAGTHPGGQEPSGAHVDAGGEGIRQSGEQGARQGELPARPKRIDEAAHEGAPEGTLQRGGISSQDSDPSTRNTR